MTDEEEMEEYRSRFKEKRLRRRTDHKKPRFWEIGIVLDFTVLVVAAIMIALTACAGRLQ